MGYAPPLMPEDPGSPMKRAACVLRCLAVVATAMGAFGCKPSIPRCEAPEPTKEDTTGPVFLLVPQVRVEAMNIVESQWSPVNVVSEVYVGGAPAGATVGYANLDGNSGFAMGASVVRYIDAPRLFAKNGWVGSLALPDADGHIYFMFGRGDPTLIASFTTDLTGFKIARCINKDACFHAAIRGPTLGPAIMFMEPDEVRPGTPPLGALVLGGSLDAGFAF